jgi:cytoskeletal protein RodZ
VSPGGGAGWDESPLDIQIPDDARELERDVLAYHRELRAMRRRSRVRRLTSPFAGQGTVMPLLASILAVCLVAGAMLSVATFSPQMAPAEHHHQPATAASSPQPTSQRPSAGSHTPASSSATARPSAPTRTASPSTRSNPSSSARHAPLP